MEEKESLKELYGENDRQYLQMMQGNIERMAANSANCKTWLVTLVSAILTLGVVIASLKGWIFLSLFPIFLLWGMDAYYLKLERGMRNRQRHFVNIMKAETFDVAAYKEALFNFRILESKEDNNETGLMSTECLAFTASVLPFYGITSIIAIIVSIVVTVS